MAAAAGRWREWGLGVVALAPLAAILSRPVLQQDPRYHVLADTRAFLGIPNFADVSSNVAFLLVGIAGLVLCAGRRVDGAARAWSVFFAGVALVFFGSVGYHWTPGNATHVWDRLPMTIAFMGLLTAVVSEHAGARLERLLLAPAVAAGIASVAWWAWTDDLRAYLWIQAAPLICIVYVLLAYRAAYTRRGYLALAFVAYAAAKAAEFHDSEVYAFTSQAVSGHTLKHLLAALGIYFVYLMLRRRTHVPGKVPAVSG